MMFIEVIANKCTSKGTVATDSVSQGPTNFFSASRDPSSDSAGCFHHWPTALGYSALCGISLV